MSFPEQDLSCPICCDIFTDPVLLQCSHSFCRMCLSSYWKTTCSRECPVCRRRASKQTFTSNLALKNLIETLKESKRLSSVLQGDSLHCSVHKEQFKLFCLVDRQPICVVCQTSKLHKSHDCLPLDEAVQDCKDELEAKLKTLRDTLETLKRAHMTCEIIVEHIKSQALKTKHIVQEQFGELHQFLYNEEAARLAALKDEEAERIKMATEKLKETAEGMLGVSLIADVLEQEMNVDNMVLLQNFKATLERANCTQGVVCVSGTLLDVSKHLCNLKFKVWENMREHVGHTPVTLDPNTAHPCLLLSDDLTSVHYSGQSYCLPDNPERFHLSAEVVGMTSLGSGSHRWTVETGSNEDWLMGVACTSVPRNVEVSARPENGFWTLCFREGELRAMTSPPTPLTVARKPQRLTVHVEWDKGEVSFYDFGNNKLLYSFIHKFTETVFPYFYTQCKYPLQILPEHVLE